MTTQLYYGSGATVGGAALVVWSERGIRALRLLQGTTRERELADLRRRFGPLVEDQSGATQWLQRVDGVLFGEQAANTIPVDLLGTPFQQRVWQALLRVPRGKTLSYQELAAKIKQPRAVRAVASACARNPICLLIPCHRIVRSDGGLGGYYYGLERKRALLELEGAACV